MLTILDLQKFSLVSQDLILRLCQKGLNLVIDAMTNILSFWQLRPLINVREIDTGCLIFDLSLPLFFTQRRLLFDFFIFISRGKLLILSFNRLVM